MTLRETIQKLDAMVSKLRKDVIDTERMIEWGRKRWGDAAVEGIADEVKELDELRVQLFDAECELSRLRAIERLQS